MPGTLSGQQGTRLDAGLRSGDAAGVPLADA